MLARRYVPRFTRNEGLGSNGFFDLSLSYLSGDFQQNLISQVTFNKTYKTKEELRNRQKIFIENKRIIDEHNQRFSKGLVTYRMSANQFTDMLFNEIESKMLGLADSKEK